MSSSMYNFVLPLLCYNNKITQKSLFIAMKFDLSTKIFSPIAVCLLQTMVVLLFVGRAWQGFFWDLPLRTFFWDEALLGGLVTTLTGDTWQHYVTNVSLPTDRLIDGFSVCLGVFWLICALGVPWGWRRPKLVVRMLCAGAFSLALLALLYAKDHYWQLAQLFEYASQVTAPLFLAHLYQRRLNTLEFRWSLRGVIALTFVCHGLYAYGYYPQPGDWAVWTRNILGIESDEQVHFFLHAMGVLDIVAVVMICLPWKILSAPALWYCIIWGALTALARLLGNFYSDAVFLSLHQHGYEVLYRLVHGGLPLLLWFCLSSSPALATDV